MYRYTVAATVTWCTGGGPTVRRHDHGGGAQLGRRRAHHLADAPPARVTPRMLAMSYYGYVIL